MKNQKNKSIVQLSMLAICLTMALGVVSCKKDSKGSTTNNNTTKPKTKTEMLAASSWKLTAAQISPAMMGTNDLYSMFDPCEKDNSYQFKNDAAKTLVLSEGSNVCSGAPASSNLTWAFQNNETELVMGSDTYTLTNFGEKAFTGKKQVLMSGTWYTITCTYSAQ